MAVIQYESDVSVRGRVLINGGLPYQFLKADGSLDSNIYALASSIHAPVTLGTANGLSLSNQQLSLGLASSSTTGALSGTDWNTFNGKFNTPTGLTTNYLPKWNGSGFGNSLAFEYQNIYTIASTRWDALVVGRTDNVNKQLLLGYNVDTDMSYIQSIEQLVGFKSLSINPLGGRVLINKTNDDLTNQLQVAGTISASPATTANQVPTWGQVQAVAGISGSYTPTVSASTNCVSPGALPSTYTKNGNTVTLRLNVLAANFTVANTLTAITVNLPVNRTLTDVKNIGSGSGFNTLGEYWAAIAQTGANNNTVLVSFRTPSTNTGNIILFVQYDITQ